MSLYHETAEILSATSSTAGGNLKTGVFGKKDLKSPQQQVYALALETCKWSPVLKEVIDKSELLRHERKLSPLLALLLVHDYILAKGGIALPATHGLRASIERHKARLNAEFTRARLRRKAGSLEALREQIATEFLGEAAAYPRWVRVNILKTTVEDQLATTFATFSRVLSVSEVTATPGKFLYVDEHVPNLLAVSPSFEFAKTEAYTSGAIILQDKASCFPAYLLDPHVEDGDVIDSCAAPGNKTTHLASIVHSRIPENEEPTQTVYAFEKDSKRSRTLEKMVKLAGAKDIIRMNFGQDFLKADPNSDLFSNVGCLLLDPSCSGSGIVGRDDMPTVHLPDIPGSSKSQLSDSRRKRKRETNDDGKKKAQPVLVDDDGKETLVSSEKELKARLEALSSFQLTLLLHAFKFPAARRITYSTCSIHAEENEQVVLKALQSDVGKQRGWRILPRDRQVRGLREWPVRGSVDASDGDAEVADACIRSYKDDGRGVMGFFVAAFVRDVRPGLEDGDGPYIRDENGRIIRDHLGMPTSKLECRPETLRGSLPNNESTQDGHYEQVEHEEEDESMGSGDLSEPSSDSDLSGADEGEWNGFGD
ncbi:S-adenosyl-L-methionine-dependent methyltransferase [Hypoxylon trugodes]|uniref:S-adenosyl-L-methionine-dependent methyltransferase n=1 Tax=Hypoxylon trugodes TaxID=326681 RepID=UPI0021A03CF4|nr:S-adenosyl-L-methionine-dependent methyltransferase [Hypoxylon trugodes]KAI1393215.1 S-adenosyl-L-methionine-dependent methyltransferase [Hypoxylon trugodes]